MPGPARSKSPRGAAERSAPLRRGLVEAEILDKAAALFAARGFAATSLQDIADALGSSRPALYHYFSNKDEILARLADGLAARTEQALARGLAGDGDVAVRLDRLVRALIEPIAESPSRFRLILTSDVTGSVDPDGHSAALRHEIFQSISTLIGEGVATGVFRRCNQTVATFAILGMINWVAWWYSDSRGPATAELCDAVADFALASVRAGGSDRRGDNPAAVIASIRRDLDLLEPFLERSAGTDEPGG
jgi:AcrR family transcriptional regulator